VELSLLTLNIMHGRNRRSAIWPPRVSKTEARGNLEKVADRIRFYGPDMVALQEVDEYSLLSGRFDQFEYLKEKTGYPYGFFAASCNVRGLFVSGQALLSKYPLQNCAGHKFPITFPTDRMGFVIADAVLPPGTVTIASVHLVYLDWLRRDSRTQELDIVEKAVAQRGGKAVLAGDFNQDFSGRNAPTYPSWAPVENRDWIITKNLQVESCQVLPDRLSDHLPVLATITP
jgi:endonuclease/exonuclease/phosphatase family metal-dependent hydrolase